jgi:hypothetical protein
MPIYLFQFRIHDPKYTNFYRHEVGRKTRCNKKKRIRGKRKGKLPLYILQQRSTLRYNDAHNNIFIHGTRTNLDTDPTQPHLAEGTQTQCNKTANTTYAMRN